MRFIHTADWHLGNQMHDIDRRAEAQAFLRWLKEQIVETQADALIVAGDIFDTANPSVEARRLYYTFLASLVETCCNNVVIVGGNHDSAVLLDAAKDLLEVLHIRVVGSINNLSPADMCVELVDADEEACGMCLAVPFAREVELRNLLVKKVAGASPTMTDIADGDLYAAAYTKLYRAVYDEAQKLRAGRNIPLIATGHLYAADLEGRLFGASASTKTDDGVKVLDVLGTLGNVPPSVFPPVDYVALGHIHYATTVAKNPAVRYSGSPFVMGFDEADLPHYVLCVDVTANKPDALKVEKIETPRTFIYRRISGTLSEINTELRALAKSTAATSAQDGTQNGSPAKSSLVPKPLYLELCYQKETGVNAQEFLDEAIRSLPDHVSVASWKILEQARAFTASGFESFDATEIKNLDDKEIFTQLILSRTGLDPASDEAKTALEQFLPLFLQAAGEVS